MAQDGLKQLLLDGIHAVQAAGKVGSDAAAQIEEQATHPELQAELQHGSHVAASWKARLEEAERLAGGTSSAPTDSDIMVAIHRTGERIARRAETDTARDLGIVATGQLALHYHIAAFGTLRAYAERLGLNEVVTSIGQCLDEAKSEDQRHTILAGKIAAAG